MGVPGEVGEVETDRPTGLFAEAAAMLASEQAVELLDEVGAIVEAEQSRLPWTERLLDGPCVQVRLWGQVTLTGSAELVGPDAFTLRLEPSAGLPQADWAIVPSAAVLLADDLPSRLAQEGSSPRLTWSLGQMLRQYLSWPVRVHLRDGSLTRGALRQVGVDHLDLDLAGKATTVPFASISALIVTGVLRTP